MKTIYLALGTNLGDRRTQLRTAISALRRAGVDVGRVAPVVETQALLLADSPPTWDKAFLNTVVEARTALSPQAVLEAAKSIEQALGRDLNGPKWAPRPIDIDILLYGEEELRTPELQVPHPEMLNRDFVLAPLAQLVSGKVIPGQRKTILGAWLELPEQTPMWMAIMNLTPDSFSDGGELAQRDVVEARVQALFDCGANFIDMGAESTRPGGAGIDAAEELNRLRPALDAYNVLSGDDTLAPKLSVDTRHAEVAQAALEAGAHVINDVSGIGDLEMMRLASESGADWVAMHHTAIPADPNDRIPEDADAVQLVVEWFKDRQRRWEDSGLDLNRIMVDPGIGFGKVARQSWDLLGDVPALHQLGQRVLIGHSRKSFLTAITGAPATSRDPETMAISLGLLDQGVSVFRVHDVDGHQRAYRSHRRLGRKAP